MPEGVIHRDDFHNVSPPSPDSKCFNNQCRGCSITHPQPQVSSSQPRTAAITNTQGAQHYTLGCRCGRKLPSSPRHPSPKEHNPAPSAADAVANCHHHRAILRPRSTILHPRQRIHTPTTATTRLTHAQGAQSRTLSNGYPANHPPNPSYPTPREHTPAPSAANAHNSRSLNPPNPRPGSTTLHPRQQIPTPAAVTTRLTHTQGAHSCTLGGRSPRWHSARLASAPHCPTRRRMQKAPRLQEQTRGFGQCG